MPAAIERDTNQTNGNADGPRRSSLVQERSRRTRQELVNAAVKLWTERGFEHGVESTTVEEIARAAGVTKGTFYFHFAHKEDVLLEMSNTAGDAAIAEADRAAA
jgi:AcrR family transcriptional regulator